MSQSAKTAIGGMITALSVVILMPTALDLFVYALPAMAGMLTMFAVVELGKKWSFGVYVAVSLISLLLVLVMAFTLVMPAAAFELRLDGGDIPVITIYGDGEPLYNAEGTEKVFHFKEINSTLKAYPHNSFVNFSKLPYKYYFSFSKIVKHIL